MLRSSGLGLTSQVTAGRQLKSMIATVTYLGCFAYRSRVRGAVAKLGAAQLKATVGKPPAITGSSLRYRCKGAGGQHSIGMIMADIIQSLSASP